MSAKDKSIKEKLSNYLLVAVLQAFCGVQGYKYDKGNGE